MTNFTGMHKILIGLMVVLLVGVIATLALTIIVLVNQDQTTTTTSVAAATTTASMAATTTPPTTPPTTTTYPPTVNASQGFRDAAAILLGAIDPTVDPCDDFYQFTCGNWLKNNPIPSGGDRIGTYDVAQNTIDTNLAMMLGNISYTDQSQPKTVQAAALLYQKCANFASDSNGATELLAALKSDGGIGFPMVEASWAPSTNDWSNLWFAVGFLESRYALSTFFQSLVTVDWGDVTRNALFVDQASLYMPRDYYVKPEFKSYLDSYVGFVMDLAQQLHDDLGSTVSNDQLRQDALDVVKLETQLAFAMTPDELLRNSAFQYNEYTVTKLNSAYQQITWSNYLRALLWTVDPNYLQDHFVLLEPAYVGVLNSLVASSLTSSRIFANYIGIKFVQDNAMFLSSNYRAAALKFRQSLNAVEDSPAVSTDCVELLTNLMPYSTGYLYVNSIPNRDAIISDVTKQSTKIITQFLKMVDSLTWMTPQSKQAAHNKAANLVKNIGMPDWLLNKTALDLYNKKYTDLMLNMTNSPLFKIMGALKFAFQNTENFQLLEQAPDRKNFLLSPAMVNAWYQPERNSITFPFAAFNPPYYRYDFPQAWNYAGQGGTGGHELTHGFDDQGVQYGPNGQLSNCTWNECTWMDGNSTSGFTDMAQCVVNQYSQQCCPVKTGNVHCANGATTQGENIADLGGQLAAYQAYQDWKMTDNNGQEELRLPGLEQYSMNQIFWITYGYSWCMNQDTQSLVNQILTNPHAPAKCRTNQVMQDIPAFGKDFNCKQGSNSMFPGPDQRCKVWTGN